MSRLRSRFHAFYRCAAFLALLAMFVPVVTGLVHHPVAATSTMMSGMMMAGQPCPMEQQSKKNDDGKNHKAPICPICQSLHILAGGYVPPALVVLAVVASDAETHLEAAQVFDIAFKAAPQARPRAPPVFA